MEAARRLEAESKLGLFGDLQPGLNSKKLSKSPNKHRRTCCRSDFDSLFSCSGGCFSLAANFQFPGNRRGGWAGTPLTQHILTCTDAHSLSAHHTWCYTLTRGSSSSCAFHKIVIPSLAQCLTPCTEHAAHLPHLFPLFQVYKGCSHAEIPALIHENTGVTDTLIQNLS